MHKSKKAQLEDPDFYQDPKALYSAKAIVAILDTKAPASYSFAQLLDNVLEETEEVKASLLQHSQDNEEDISYTQFSEAKIKTSMILRDVPYQIEKQKDKKAKSIYHIHKSLSKSLQKLAQMQKALISQEDDLKESKGSQKTKLTQGKRNGKRKASAKSESSSSESSSEDEDEDEEMEEEEVEEDEQVGDVLVYMGNDTSRVLKRVKGKKRNTSEPKKKEATEEKPKEEGAMEEEKSKEEIKPKGKPGRGKGKKAEEVVDGDDKEGSGKKEKKTTSRATKKKPAETGEITTKKDDFEDKGDEDKENGEEKEKKKKTKKTTEKAPRKKKEKDEALDTYVKGKFNPNVEEISHHDLVDNPSEDMIDYGCISANNKNLFRAVKTKNYTLLDKVLKSDYFLSTLHQKWAPETDMTALEFAILQKDDFATKAILECEYERTKWFLQEPTVALKNIDTGNVSKTAFGVEIRKVKVMRGAREGNTAFTHNTFQKYINLNSIFALPLSHDIVNEIAGKAGYTELYTKIDKLILQGDRTNAGYLVTKAVAAGGYGFNKVHEEALTIDKSFDLTPITKKVAVLKATNGNSSITPIHCACINPNAEILNTLLGIAPEYNVSDEKMRKPIHYAACCDGPGPLKLLLSKGVDPSEKDLNGMTPFMYACYHGKVHNIEVLMKEAGVKATEKSKDGTMGIHYAIQKGQLEVLKYLAKNGVSMSVKGGVSKMSPTHYAAAYGHLECFKFLLEKGNKKGKVLGKDKLKRTPLTLAVKNGNLQMASYLLHYGADYEQADSSNNYPIHYAAAYGFPECIDVLVKAGADVNIKNLWNLTPLTVAMMKNNFHCVKKLLSYTQTDIDAKDDDGRTLVSLLIDNPSEDTFNTISFLVKDRNCSINDADRQGMLPLHYACQLQAESFAQRDPNTNIPLPESVIKMQEIKMKIVKLLLECGADVNAKNTRGEVPMLLAITYFDLELIETLLEHKTIDLTFTDNDKNNIYRLLYDYTLDSEEERQFLEKILQIAGNTGNILNSEIEQPKHTYRYRQSKTKKNQKPVFDPMVCNESAFTCYKRTLMTISHQEYLNSEEWAAKSIKRERLLEQQEQQKKQQQDASLSVKPQILPLAAVQSVPHISYITLTEDEQKEYKQKAYEKIDAFIIANMRLLEKFVEAGGVLSPTETLLSQEEYWNDPRFMLWMLHSFKPDLNLPDPRGNTALFYLISHKYRLNVSPSSKQALIDYLVEAGSDREQLEKYSDFRLFLELFNKFGANFNHRNTSGVTPIFQLLRERHAGNTEFLEELMQYGADLHQCEDVNGSTPLIEAIHAHDIPITEKLISLNVNVNHQDKRGKSPLHYIAEMRHPRAVDIIQNVLKAETIQVDVKETVNGRTPLHLAILSSAKDVVEVLLNAGANVNETDKTGSNALYFATQVNNLDLMQIVSIKTADINSAGPNGFTALHVAVNSGRREHVEYLLKIEANPNTQDNRGMSPLITAVTHGKIDIVRLLLQKGADPNLKDDYDITALHYAVSINRPEQMFQIEDSLIKYGAQVNAEDMYGRTPFHYAFTGTSTGMYNHYNRQNDPAELVISLCAVKGIDLDVKDRRGRRAIHYAAEKGAYICLLLLFEKELTLDEADADGNTPLALALMHGHKDFAAVLIQRNLNVTNMIHTVNVYNYLWAHPRETQGTKPKQTVAQNQKMEIEIAKESAKGVNIAEQAQEKMIEEAPIETKEEKEAKRQAEIEEAKKIPTAKIQQKLYSFFALSVKNRWQGVAYLLLQHGYPLMDAIKDALNENQFNYVLGLMTKVSEDMMKEIDDKGQTLFHVLAMRGRNAPVEMIENVFNDLMAKDIDFNVVDSQGRTPLHYAAETNFLFLEDKLLEAGADPNLLDKNGNDILHLAITANNMNVDRLTKYHKYGIKLNKPYVPTFHAKPPLLLIAENGYQQPLEKELLNLGANPNIVDGRGYTPLQIGFMNHRITVETLRVYAEHGADLNRKFTIITQPVKAEVRGLFNQNKIEAKEVGKAKTETRETYTLLSYAAKMSWSHIEDELLSLGADASIENEEGKTAFDIALAQTYRELTPERVKLYIQCKAPVNKPTPCTIKEKVVDVTPVLYLLNQENKKVNPDVIKELLDAGVSINDVDDDGWTPIIYAIRRNLLSHLEIFLSYANIDPNMRDKNGKTPIHHVVNPMEYASYENAAMLELLAKHFDVNAVDNRGKPPIYYANFQDSGIMKNTLIKLGAKEVKEGGGLRRSATSVIADVDWTEEIDYETDADKFIDEEEKKKMEGEAEPIPPDSSASNRHYLEVVYDDEMGPYSLFMTKVDIGKGTYGEYLFYRMQVLYDKNRDNYFLFTKWGRIGDEGMYQQTPYPSKEDTINEFLKIFKDKSGNEWKNKATFQKVERKYKLLNFSTRKNQRHYIKPIDWKDKSLPEPTLDEPILNVIRSISDINLFRGFFDRYHIDEKVLPFGKLTKELIYEAKAILLSLREFIEELEEQTKDTVLPEEEKVQKIVKVKEKIIDKSNKFYELIPDSRFQLVPVAPIDNMTILDEKVRLVNDMLDFQVSSKILLGAQSCLNTKNPLDYYFEALNIRLLTLSKNQVEYKLISDYVYKGKPDASPDFIVNIFALERRGEAERISQWKDLKNRTYLWHGSKIMNFMGILSQGLRIAPPEAPATGYMFGKGIYFADSFSKSYGYCANWSYRGSENTKLLLICEVALGESLELFNANYITELAPPYKSVKGCGRRGPDPTQNITIANGAIVPIGNQINYDYKDPVNGGAVNAYLNFNEYIVYDISQVRMRYLIQVKY